MQVGILDGQDFSRKALQLLEAIGPVEVFTGNKLASFLSDKEVLFIRLSHYIGAEFLSLAPDLKIIVSPTTGHTHLDLDECARRGIELLSLKGRTAFLERVSATPEHALGLLISLFRNYRRAFMHPNGQTLDRNALRGHDIKGATIGIMGFGRVGRRLARALEALEADVIYYDVEPIEHELRARPVDSISDLAKNCVAFVVAASIENGAPPAVTASVLDLLQGKYLVNIARGELIDEEALIERITRDYFAGVALDVICRENDPDNNLTSLIALAQGRNLIITPHIGGATYQSSEATELHMVDVLLDKMRLVA